MAFQQANPSSSSKLIYLESLTYGGRGTSDDNNMYTPLNTHASSSSPSSITDFFLLSSGKKAAQGGGDHYSAMSDSMPVAKTTPPTPLSASSSSSSKVISTFSLLGSRSASPSIDGGRTKYTPIGDDHGSADDHHSHTHTYNSNSNSNLNPSSSSPFPPSNADLLATTPSQSDFDVIV